LTEYAARIAAVFAKEVDDLGFVLLGGISALQSSGVMPLFIFAFTSAPSAMSSSTISF